MGIFEGIGGISILDRHTKFSWRCESPWELLKVTRKETLPPVEVK